MTLRLITGVSDRPTAGLPFESILDGTGRRRLRSLVEFVDLAPGELVAEEGDVGRDFLVVADGVLKLCKRLDDDRRQTIDFRLAGDIVTLHRCHTPWPTTARAVVASRLYRVDWDALRHLADRHPRIDRALADLAGDESAAMAERLLALGRKTTEEKVATFLLEFCQRAAMRSGPTREFQLPMRRPEIADYLGLTTESVSREFTRLKRERIVALPRPSRVVILNRPELEGLAFGAKGLETGQPLRARGSG